MANNNVPEIKELTKIQEGNDLKTLAANAAKSLAFAKKLEVKEEKDFELANSTLSDVKEEIFRGTKTRKFFGDPYRLLVEKINGLFMPSIQVLENARRVIECKLVVYHKAEEAKAEKKRLLLAKQLEEKKITPGKAADKAEKIIAPAKTTQSPLSGVQTTFKKKMVAKIVDESKLPREYLVPDTVKISKVALAGVAIPGVEVVEETSISSSRKGF